MSTQTKQDKNHHLQKQNTHPHQLDTKPLNNNSSSVKQADQTLKKDESSKNKTEANPQKQSNPPVNIELKQKEEQQIQHRYSPKVKTNQQVKMEVKKWKQISDTLRKKREIQYQLFKKKLQLDKEKQAQESKEKFQAQQEQKRDQIKKKLQQINQRKQKRNEQIETERRMRKEVSEEKKEPLYQEKQKQFHMKRLVQEAKIRQNIIKKKQQMMLDMNELKQHQQKFLNHLKQRLSKKKKANQNDPHQQGKEASLGKNHKSSFNIFLAGDPARKQKDMQKYLRRKKFEQKVKKMPIFIDEQKMKQALIAKDKSKNPLKYNYLSNVAALSDEKIYDEFKDFEININQKQLGNDYMRQVHQKIPQTSRIRSQSQSRLQPLQKYQYKNYLPDVKQRLKKKSVRQKSKPNDEVEQILYRYESNSDRLVQLNKKSDFYKNEVLKKIAQIKSSSPTTAYTDYLGKERAIDDLYMKSIKMKIATAQIS